MRRAVLGVVAVGLLSACIGPAFLPKATAEKVTPADIVGTWQYPAEFGATAVTIELKAGGRFVQTVRHAGGRVQAHEGPWALDGPYPRLEVLKPVSGEPRGQEWVVEGVRWWVVGSHREGVRFALFGAAGDHDPDSCAEFERVP
ncbi:Uncharacterized protein OS=Leptospira santarosai serovar Shermani str. LT 821 GN=LSS_13204 PE=4 SV=2 [Gemmata massiliana]|uniref:Lipoprotein n=1 Tax=Gemmata massiliana TaxID=1210884 RepID=A0A6P2D679_9BACT|nr:hypothetical protein [Gemmata massiliana]VTR96503.1 Uncharacterized protein OS=Leptospira santarosai serovar Shermani str. LT 821 GN=LSS_13204 PE=4 SV=2 [Gemmata massiliana]